ncbi:hypothetical protein D9M69_370150 [compost metagenome]
MAADRADHHLLLDQVERGVRHLQALQVDQRAAVRRLDGEVGHRHGGIAELQFGALGQVQAVVAGQVELALFQHQRHGVAHIGPDALELAVGDLEVAAGGDRRQADPAVPVDLATIGPLGHQGHVRLVFRQGAEVLQFEVERVVDELHRLAGAQVLEVQAALDQGDVVDAQREGLARRLVGGLRLARRQGEQLGQVEGAVLGEQHLGVGLLQLDRGQVQRAAPQAVRLQVGVQALEAELGGFPFADMQAPERQLQAERVELQPLQAGRHLGVVGQLLVDHVQGDARQDEEAQQAVESQGDQQRTDGAFQSFVHGSASSSRLRSA